MNVLKLIASRNFITVNKDVAKAVGLIEANVLGALCSELVYCESVGRTTEDGFFPFSIELLQEETTLGRSSQDTAIAHLVSAGLVEQKNFGIPNKRHFRINEEAVEKLLFEQTSLSADNKQVCMETTNCIVCKEQTNSNKDSKKVCNKVEEEVKEEVEPFADDVPQVTGSFAQDEDGRIAEIIKSWNAQKNIRTTIDRILPLSKRYNDTFLTISQFGYDTFIYQILSLDNNQFFEEWKPSYDWFCQPNNFNKVFDGNYRFGKAKEVDKYSKEYWDSL